MIHNKASYITLQMIFCNAIILCLYLSMKPEYDYIYSQTYVNRLIFMIRLGFVSCRRYLSIKHDYHYQCVENFYSENVCELNVAFLP